MSQSGVPVEFEKLKVQCAIGNTIEFAAQWEEVAEAVRAAANGNGGSSEAPIWRNIIPLLFLFQNGSHT